MTSQRIPVTVLSGFLGSGKTTVLNHLLRQPVLDGTVAIINEFGAVGLDHLLVETSEEQMALLDNGCICCTVRDDLVTTLKDIAERSGKGDMPIVRRILIETTGLADPVPILHTLVVEPEIAEKYSIDGVAVTVDAVNGLGTLERHSEAAKQVAVADCILITKTDIAGPDEISALERRVAALSPTAARMHVAHGVVGAETLLSVGGFDTGPAASDASAWFREAVLAAEYATDGQEFGCNDPDCDHDGHDHVHQDHHHGIHSYAFTIDQPLEWPAFAQWLEYLTMLKGEDLLRMKGLVHLTDDSDRPLVVHAVQSVIHPPKRLAGWPDDDRRSRIVFIVRDIPRETIERTLARFASVGAENITRPAQQEKVA